MDGKLILRRVGKYLDDRRLKYDTDEEKKLVYLSIGTDDVPVRVFFNVDEKKQMLRAISPMPFNICEDKRVEAAIAVCAVNYQLFNGNFDLDVSDGSIAFRVAVPYEGGLPDESIKYLFGVTYGMADEYNDKFLMLNKGIWDLGQFLKEIAK